MLIIEEIEVCWTPANRKWYEDRGHVYSYRERFKILSNELPVGSKIIVKVMCDYCGTIVSKHYCDFIRDYKVVEINSCKKCTPLKIKEVNFKLYGVENPLQRKEIKEKLEKTNLERYGYKNPAQNKTVKNKIKETNLNNHGFEHHTQTDDWKNKVKNVFLKKFGTESPMQNEKVKEKFRKTLYDNGSAPISAQQLYIHKILGGELNFPHRTSSLDIAFPKEKIYLEYDGGGHRLQIKLGNVSEDDFIKNERSRSYALMRKGWKEIRIISKDDRLPSQEIILEMIKYARLYLNTGHSWIHFNIDEKVVLCSQFTEEYDFGVLVSANTIRSLMSA